MNCERCGQTHGPCKGHNKAGGPCGAKPRRGATVCHKHGGAAPQVKAKAELRVAEAKAAEAVETLGLPVAISPTDALLEEVHRTAGHVRWVEGQVRELAPDALTWGITQRKDIGSGEFPGIDVTEAAALNVWIDLYHRERKHLIDVCKAAIAAGIEERRVRLAEMQGELAGQALRAILAGLDLTREQRERVPTLVRRHLAVVPDVA